MALKMQTTLKGLDVPNAYYKITHFSFIESGSDENGKLYTGYATVNNYTDDTKEYDIEQKVYPVENLTEVDLTLPTLYVKLKAKPEFEGAIDA